MSVLGSGGGGNGEKGDFVGGGVMERGETLRVKG